MKDGYVNPNERKTTDFAFAIIFLITSAFMLIVSIFGVTSVREINTNKLDIYSNSTVQIESKAIFNDLYLSSRAMYLSLVTGLLYTFAYLHLMKKY